MLRCSPHEGRRCVSLDILPVLKCEEHVPAFAKSPRQLQVIKSVCQLSERVTHCPSVLGPVWRACVRPAGAELELACRVVHLAHVSRSHCKFRLTSCSLLLDSPSDLLAYAQEAPPKQSKPCVRRGHDGNIQMAFSLQLRSVSQLTQMGGCLPRCADLISNEGDHAAVETYRMAVQLIVAGSGCPHAIYGFHTNAEVSK